MCKILTVVAVCRSLSHNELNGTLPSSWGNLSSLERLYVRFASSFFFENSRGNSCYFFLFFAQMICVESLTTICLAGRCLRRGAISRICKYCMFWIVFFFFLLKSFQYHDETDMRICAESCKITRLVVSSLRPWAILHS